MCIDLNQTWLLLFSAPLFGGTRRGRLPRSATPLKHLIPSIQELLRPRVRSYEGHLLVSSSTGRENLQKLSWKRSTTSFFTHSRNPLTPRFVHERNGYRQSQRVLHVQATESERRWRSNARIVVSPRTAVRNIGRPTRIMGSTVIGSGRLMRMSTT